MWLGLLHLTTEEIRDAEGGDVAILYAYTRDDPVTVGGPVTMAPQLVRLLRASADGHRLGLPRCQACRQPLEVPPLDDLEAACAST